MPDVSENRSENKVRVSYYSYISNVYQDPLTGVVNG